MPEQKFDKELLEQSLGDSRLIINQREIKGVPSYREHVEQLVRIYGGELITDIESDERIQKEEKDITDLYPVQGDLGVVIFQGRNEKTFDRQVVNELPSLRIANTGKEGLYKVPVEI